MLKLRDLPLGLYEKSISPYLSWEDKFRLVKDAGYDYLVIAVDGTKERLSRFTNREEQLQIRRSTEKLEMPLYSMVFSGNRFYPLGSEDDEIRREGIRLLKQAVDYAAFIGISIVNIAAYDEYEKPRNSNTVWHFMESLKQCVDHAATRAVIITLEPLDSTFMDSTKKALKYVRGIGSPWLQICADPGNISAMGHDPIFDIPVGMNHLANVELKDTKPGIVRDIFFGEGTVDFATCFKMLHENRYQGLFTAEMWWQEKVEMQPDIYKARAFLKNKMGDY